MSAGYRDEEVNKVNKTKLENLKRESLVDLEKLKETQTDKFNEEILDIEVLDIAFSYGEHRTHTES